MAKFLNTSATNYYLEELMKQAYERLIIISPFLKFNDRIKELLTDKDRLKIDVRIVYGKSELAPKEINWLRSLEFVRTSFCQNLHAKCYINEQAAIITSMNLYDFSQVNNNEMGIYIEREHEAELYRDTHDEAQRLIRISEQVRLAAEAVEDAQQKAEVPSKETATRAKQSAQAATNSSNNAAAQAPQYDKLTLSRLAKARGLSTAALAEALLAKGWLERVDKNLVLTKEGEHIGGEMRTSKRPGQSIYTLWPKDLEV